MDLYREGKNYRQIAKIARISVKDIKPILQKYGADSASRYAANDYRVEDIPISSKAYKLFSEGKSPLQVSIELNLRAPEVKTLYKEYWELRRMHILAKTYLQLCIHTYLTAYAFSFLEHSLHSTNCFSSAPSGLSHVAPHLGQCINLRST
jgi:hypothetical protein